MAKKHALNLSIPTPCHESWDNMTANEHGRHCSSCNKTVIDFSLYTDKELVEFFKTAKRGTVCGRINTYQVNRTIVITEQNNRTFFHKLFLGSALASWLGFGTAAHAQQNKPVLTLKQPGSAQHTHALRSASSQKDCRVNGKVVDKDNQPLTDGHINIISVVGDSVLASINTDSLGNFYAAIPANYLGKKLNAYFNFEGYKDKEVKFTLKKESYIKIKLTHREYSHIVGRFDF